MKASNSIKIERALHYFKKSYSCKMGGTQTVILPNGKLKFFDDREFYSGRGSKYNSSIRHDSLGIVKVSRKEYSEYLKWLKEQQEMLEIRAKAKAEKYAQMEVAKTNGVYLISEAGFVELTEEEAINKTFDVERLAKTLDISVEDASLLKSEGKTYVFAKQISSGKVIELYHPSLSCNDLSISISCPTDEEIAKFNHEEWSTAPYAYLLGQTEKKNHFVC